VNRRPARETSIHDRFWAEVQDWDWNAHGTRVEGLKGFPDWEGVAGGVWAAVEYKAARLPARPETRIKVRYEDGQVQWLEDRWRAGARSYVLLQLGSGRGAPRFVVRGRDAARLEEGLTVSELSALAVPGPPVEAVFERPRK